MNTVPPDIGHRADRLVPEIISHFQLDLSGLTVYTEAASGPYLYTPILACCAGAKDVIAYTRDSVHGSAEQIIHGTVNAAENLGVSKVLHIVRKKTRDDFSAADIVTNTGFVRPIDVKIVEWMKPTAVIPLMWETWEFRPDELDLEACRQKGIAVLGTNEHEPPCDMTLYSGLFALKLLFALGIEVVRCRVALLGAQKTLGGAIHDQLIKLGCVVKWFGSTSDAPLPYESLRQHFLEHGASFDAILIAEHHDQRQLLGAHGPMSFAEIHRLNPSIRIGVISGNIDVPELRRSGLHYLPTRLRGAGYMSYQASELGPRPVLELYAAGLKVGETMARARLRGKDPREAVNFALKNSPAMDFESSGEEP